MDKILLATSLLLSIKRRYIDCPSGYTDEEMMAIEHISRATVSRYRKLLNAQQVSPGRYTVEPDIDDLEYANAVYRRTQGLTLDDLVARNERPWHDRWKK